MICRFLYAINIRIAFWPGTAGERIVWGNFRGMGRRVPAAVCLSAAGRIVIMFAGGGRIRRKGAGDGGKKTATGRFLVRAAGIAGAQRRVVGARLDRAGAPSLGGDFAALVLGTAGAVDFPAGAFVAGDGRHEAGHRRSRAGAPQQESLFGPTPSRSRGWRRGGFLPARRTGALTGRCREPEKNLPWTTKSERSRRA